MKHLIYLFVLFISIKSIAQKKVTYVKMERTPCFGKCPSYEIEISNKGVIKYTGKRNVDKLGTHNYKLSPSKVNHIFALIEKKKISSLPSSYEPKASDLPRLNLSFIIKKKKKSIINCDDGPAYLKQIAFEIDKLYTDNFVEATPTQELPEITIPIEEIVEEPKIFNVVEQMPEFPAGQSALTSYLVNKLYYPEIARQNNIQGKVICNFVINEDGNITNVKVVKSLSKECDAEAVRVISNMPKWKPGKQNGKPVKTYMNLPINFKLE